MRVKIRGAVGFLSHFLFFPLSLFHISISLEILSMFTQHSHPTDMQACPKYPPRAAWRRQTRQAEASKGGDAGAACRTGNGHAHTGVRQHWVRSSKVG